MPELAPILTAKRRANPKTELDIPIASLDLLIDQAI